MILYLGFLDSEPLNNMLDDMISNAIDNYEHPRKHVTYDDRMAHVDVWHSFLDWALYYSGLPGGKIVLLLVWITRAKSETEIAALKVLRIDSEPGYDYKQGLKGLDPATRVSCNCKITQYQRDNAPSIIHNLHRHHQRIWLEKYVSQLMSQYKYGQMVPYIGWGGKQVMLMTLMVISKQIYMILICQMLDWGASDFGTDLGRCHFIGAVQNEEESIKVVGNHKHRLINIVS